MKTLKEMKEILGVENFNMVAKQAAMLNSSLAKYSPQGIIFHRPMEDDKELKEFSILAWSSEFQNYSDLKKDINEYESEGWTQGEDTYEDDTYTVREYSEDGGDFWECLVELDSSINKLKEHKEIIEDFFM